MTTTIYEIRTNHEYNSNEVYFDGKPSEQVRQALKDLRMRWHGMKRCWYGYADQDRIIAAINEATPKEEHGGTVSDGYLGAIRWDGVKSDRYLFGSDLSAAIRQDIKAAGIKGATVRCSKYSGGQHVTVTVKIPRDEYISEAEYIDGYRIKGNQYWISLSPTETIHADQYWGAETSAKQEEMRIKAAKYEYWKATTGSQDCYRAESAIAVAKSMKDRLFAIQSIIESYNHDDSNSMVDYFDTNFYWDMSLIPA